MRGIRAVLIAVVALAIAGVAGAGGPMTLTKSGDLYRVSKVDGQLVVSAEYADGTLAELPVPQSDIAVRDSLQVGVDETSGALFVLWQKNTGLDAKVRIATFVDGTWIGPYTIAGNDGTAAFNPQLMVHRARNEIVEDPVENEEPEVTVFETTFIHIAWWRQLSEDEPGTAMYAWLPVASDGTPQLDSMDETVLSDLLPYGTTCFEVEDTDNLKHPKLFVDPQSRIPHIFLSDYLGCAFQIMELRPVVVDIAEDLTKRRRQIIILRHGRTVAMRRDLPLASAKMEIGGDLSILMHWDGADDTLLYLELDPDGISETKSLALSDELDHERAVELIRGLTN
jgi:hypothetical protein